MEKNLAIVDAEALLDPDNWQRDSDLDLYESARFPCSEAPRFSGDVSWTFVIDLDRIIFTVDWHAHFDLFNVALGLADEEDWFDYLRLDGRGCRCLDPNTPRELLPSTVPFPIEPVSDAAVLQDLTFTRVMNDVGHFEHASSDTFQECAVQMAKGFITSFYQVFSEARFYRPTTAEFQQRAAFLLSIIAPDFLAFPGGFAEPGAKIRENRRFHDGLDLGIFYWFRSCLIMMVDRLDVGEDHFHKCVSGVVKRIRKHKLKSCTALIWSMCHVVIVIVNDDLVQHSPVFPLIAAFRVDDHRLEVTLRVLASYLSPIQELIAGGTARRLAFQTPRLPAEMVSHIMGFMDHSSYYRMRHVCWATRMECIRRPFIGPYRVCRAGGEGGAVFGSIDNSKPERISFVYRMLSDESPWEVDPEWTNIVARFPVFKGSCFSFEDFEDCKLDFYVGQAL